MIKYIGIAITLITLLGNVVYSSAFLASDVQHNTQSIKDAKVEQQTQNALVLEKLDGIVYAVHELAKRDVVGANDIKHINSELKEIKTSIDNELKEINLSIWRYHNER